MRNKFTPSKISFYFLLISLAVAFLCSPPRASAQYMVMEGNSGNNIVGCGFTAKSNVVDEKTMFVQDYQSINGINNSTAETEFRPCSTEILTGFFDGYLGGLGLFIGIPAMLIAGLRMFVQNQSVSKPKKKSFELPQAPEPARYLKPSYASRFSA